MEEQIENINTDSVEVKEFSYSCLEFHPLQYVKKQMLNLEVLNSIKNFMNFMKKNISA